MVDAAYVAKRAGVAVAVVVLVLVVAAVGGAVLQSLLTPSPDQSSLEAPEYDPEAVGVTAGPETGNVTPSAPGGEGVVLVDNSHGNRFDRGKIRPIAEALVGAGYEVRFYESGNFSEALADADAYLVVDPGEEHDRDEIEQVRQFTDRGGRVVVLGEPTRRSISIGLTGVSITAVRSDVNGIATEYGMNVDTEYVYNQIHNDGGYKNPLVRPTDAAGFNADRVAFLTATRISTPGEGADVVMRARENTRVSGTDERGQFPVAARNGNVLVFGDSSFIDSDSYAIADNEAVVTYIVEFMLGTIGAPDDGTSVDAPAPGGG